MTTQYVNGPDGRLWILMDDRTYDEFVELINRPESNTPKLAELFARRSPWDEGEES